MIIDKDTVKRVAHLARLSLTEGEMAGYVSQLEHILLYISKLSEIDTSDVTPTSHPFTALKNVYRNDVLKPSLTVDQALQNAPSKDGEFFKVPQIIENR